MPKPTSRSDSRLFYFSALLLGLSLRLWIAWRPLPILDNLFFPDDTYISMAIARNIALGKGMTFDGLVSTNGFQPLYVFLLVPLFRLIPGNLTLPIHIAVTGLALLNVACAYLLARVTRHAAGELAGQFALIIWLFAPPVIHEGLNGLETGLALFFTAAALAVYMGAIVTSISSLWRLILTGLLAGLATFARIDNGILLVVLAAHIFWNEPGFGRQRIQRTLIFGIMAGLVLLPWFIISWHCCQTLMPESGQAVRFQALASFHDIPGQVWTLVLYNLVLTFRILAQSPMQLDFPLFWAAFIGVVVASALMAYRNHINWRSAVVLLQQTAWIRTLQPAWLYALGLLIAYNGYVLAYWFFVRYFYAVIWVTTMIWAILLARFSQYLSRKLAKPNPGLNIGLTVVLLLWFAPGIGRFLFSTPQQGGYYNIAMWANETMPPDTVLGSAQSGALTYFARPDLTIVNMDGVANREAFAALRQKQQFVYLRAVGLDYIVNWPINMDLLRDYGGESLDTALESLGPVADVETLGQRWFWYRLRPPS